MPTAVELGYQVTQPQFRSVVVRSGTDAGVVKKLADTLAETLRDPEYVAFLKDEYADADSFVSTDASVPYFERLLDGTNELIARSNLRQGTAQPGPTR